jgi:hypothetical protein
MEAHGFLTLPKRKEFQQLVAKGLGQRVYARLPKTANYRQSAMPDGTTTES